MLLSTETRANHMPRVAGGDSIVVRLSQINESSSSTSRLVVDEMVSLGKKLISLYVEVAVPQATMDVDRGDDATQRTTASRDGRNEKAQWQLKYGFRSEVDLQYDALSPPVKPRLPRADEATGGWRQVLFPDTLDEFLGNAGVVARVRALERGEVSLKSNFIISGGEGTGKQALLRLLKQILVDVETTMPCVFLTFQAKASSDKELVAKIEHAVNRLDTEKTTAFIVIESFECLPIAVQQHHLLPFLTVCNAKNIFAILLVRPDASKLPDQLKQRALHLHLQPLSAPLVRKKLLLVCQHQKIGYTRDGLEELLRRCRSQLLPSLGKLHQVFLAYHFVSLPNVLKALQARKIGASGAVKPMCAIVAPPPYPLSIIRMSEPLRRCKTCTLLPPCAHVTLQSMYDRTDRTRQLYPTRENEPDAIVCPSFTASGICRNIQSIGRCRYAHPHNLHTIDVTPLVKRCNVHTLPLPCLHCTNLSEMKKQLNQEQARCTILERELRDLKKQLADKETEHYLFVREQSKSVKWGAMRKEYEEQRQKLDLDLTRIRKDTTSHQQELRERRVLIYQLQDSVQRGRSKGLGKGNGKLGLVTPIA